MRVCGQLPARDAASMREFEARGAQTSQAKTRFESRTRKRREPFAPAPTRSKALKLIEFGAGAPTGRTSSPICVLCEALARNQSHRDPWRLPQHHKRVNATRPPPCTQRLQHPNTLTQKHSSTNTNARPPRRGPKPGNDAAQLRRDAAAAALPSSLNAGDAAVCQCAGHPSGDANRESEKGKAEAPEFGAEAPRSNKSEDVRAVAP